MLLYFYVVFVDGWYHQLEQLHQHQLDQHLLTLERLVVIEDHTYLSKPSTKTSSFVLIVITSIEGLKNTTGWVLHWLLLVKAAVL